MAEQGHDFFDFGFSAVDINELEELQEKDKQIQSASGEAAGLQERLEDVYNAIQPLLNNLKSDPNKDYIYWKDRLPKIEAFEAHLAKLYYGKK